MNTEEKKQLDALLRKYAAEKADKAEITEASRTLLEELEGPRHPAEKDPPQIAGRFNMLRLSEAERLELLQSLLELQEFSFWCHEHATGQVFWSQNLHEQLGFSPREPSMDFRAIMEFVNDKDRESFRQAYEQHLATGEPMNIMLRMKSKQGSLRYFRNIGRTRFDAAGQPVRSYGVMLDLTRLTTAEERLNESELQARQLFESMNTGVVFHQTDGSIYRANPAAAAILGLSIDQLLGRDSMDARWHAIRGDGRPFPGEEHPAMQALASGQPVRNVEMGVYHPEKKAYVWILTSAEPQFRPGEEKPYQVFATFSDITAQRRMTEELQRREQMQQLLADLAAEFINLPPQRLDAALNESLKKLGQFVEADRTYVFEYDFPNMECSNTHEWCAPGITPEINNLQQVPIDMIPHWWQKHKQGEALYVKDVLALDKNDGVRQILEPQGVKSLLALPVSMPDGSCWGFVGFDSVEKHHSYSEEELRILEVFTDLIASVRSRLAQLQEITQSQNLLDSMIRNNPLITMIKDRQGRFLKVNHAFERHTGRPEEAVLGKTDAEIYDAQTARGFMENDKEVLERGRIIEKEEYMFGERKRYFKVIKFPLYDAAGTITGLGSMINEFTELRETRKNIQLFSRIIEQSPNEIYIFEDESFRMEQANPAALEHLGYSLEELRQLKATDLKPEISEQEFRELIAPLYEQKEAAIFQPVHFETVHQTKSGNTYPVEVQIARIEFEGEFRLASLAINITERHRRRNTIVRQNKTLKNIAWQQSHEIRAPLARLLGLVEALEDEEEFPVLQQPAQKPLKELLEHVHDTAIELDSIVTRISKKTARVEELQEKGPARR